MNCPRCGSGNVSLTTPDYGRGAEFACYSCSPYGDRFVSDSAEARAASASAHQASAANARRVFGPCVGPVEGPNGEGWCSAHERPWIVDGCAK